MYIVLDLFHILGCYLYRIYGMQINSIQFNEYNCTFIDEAINFEYPGIRLATAINEYQDHGGIYHCIGKFILKYKFPLVYVYTDNLHAHPIPEITEENRSAST
jgi:hypothetical protein